MLNSQRTLFTVLDNNHLTLKLLNRLNKYNPRNRFNNFDTRGLKTTAVKLTLPRDSVMHVFDRNTKLLQRERAAVETDVQCYDYIKDEVGYRLSDRIFDIKKKFKKALDLGCGRGHVSKHIYSESVEELVLADMSPTLLEQAQTTQGMNFKKIVLDEENPVLEPNSFDLIISSLRLHWVNDLPGCFKSINNALKNDGVFMAALFGGDTLYELRGSLQLAELERLGGIGMHISPFVKVTDLGALLTRANFTMLTIDTDEMVVGYPTIFELMMDLKGMAENNAGRNRPPRLSKDTLMAAAAIYKELYGKTKEDGSPYIPATFQIFYLLGWKPDPSQPKPLERGTGEVSFKDLYRLDEIAKEKEKIQIDEDK